MATLNDILNHFLTNSEELKIVVLNKKIHFEFMKIYTFSVITTTQFFKNIIYNFIKNSIS